MRYSSYISYIYLVRCSPPIVGANVSVQGYSSGLEGSQITYYCQPGLLPSERMVANCTSDGTWSPDPTSLECHQGIKKSHNYILPNQILSVHVVTPSVKCQFPDNLKNEVIIDSIAPGWKSVFVTFYCNKNIDSKSNITSVCTKDGIWSPKIDQLECFKEQTAGAVYIIYFDNKYDAGLILADKNLKVIVSLFTIICSTVTYILGILSGVFILKCLASKCGNQREGKSTETNTDKTMSACDFHGGHLHSNIAYEYHSVQHQQ